MHKNGQNTHVVLFLHITCFFIILFFIINLLTHGKYLDSYLLRNHFDSGMDYYNMLALCIGDPYSGHANYPALCFIYWKSVFNLLPLPIIPEYGDGFYLRQHMVAYLSFITFIITNIVIIIETVKNKTNSLQTTYKILFIFCIILCGPMIFCIERGNILLAAFSLTLFFCFNYNSESKKVRYLSYLALSIAAGIKLYPALFGLLVIYEGRNKETRDLIIMGLLMFIIPFFFFNGFDSIIEFASGYTKSVDIGRSQGLGYNYSFDTIMNSFLTLIGKNNTVTPTVSSIIGLFFSVTLYVTSKEKWKKIFSITLACVWVPSFSYTYTLLFFIIPIIFYLFSNDDQKQHYTLIFALIISPILSPMADFVNGQTDYNLPLSIGTLTVNCLILLITIMMLKDNITQKRAKSIS